MRANVNVVVLVALASLVAPGLVGCGDDQDPDAAAALWARIQSEGYRGFARAPGYEARQPSNTAHSDQVDIYVNAVIADALAAGEPLSAWPVGALIVKDGFTDSGDHALVAAMDKRADGWFWAEWSDVTGESAKYSGQPSICIDCHASGEDMVRAFGLP
jgi:hypothetical protein